MRLRRGILLLSAVRQHALRALLHRLVDHVVLAQATQALARLLLHPVVAARLGATHATRSGHPEALGRSLFRLHFRHGADPRETPFELGGVRKMMANTRLVKAGPARPFLRSRGAR